LVLRSTGTREAPRLSLQVLGERVTAAARAAARARVERIFNLRVDPAPFLALAERDPLLAPLVARAPGVRPVLVAEPFEALLWAVMGQQINTAFARKLKLALVALSGGQLRAGG